MVKVEKSVDEIAKLLVSNVYVMMRQIPLVDVVFALHFV